MGDNKAKNKICDTLDDIKQIKQDVFNLISRIKTFCNFHPAISFPSSLPSALNIKQAVLQFLRDLLAVLQGVDIEKIKNAIVNWLTIEVIPIEFDIKFQLKAALKNCYACKISPTIPGWLFQTTVGTEYDEVGIEIIDPATNDPIQPTDRGLGINLPVNVLDLKTCFLKVNPNSRGGRLLYGDSQTDMNRFLWDVIQANGNTLVWKNPDNQRPIAHFTYYEDETYAFVSATDNSPGYQNKDVQQMVINMKIDDSFKSGNFLSFINEYLNSQLPIFSGDKVVSQAIDYLYGTITKEISLPPECVENAAIFDAISENMYDSDEETEEATTDDSFFEFSAAEIINIKETANNKLMGQRYYTTCCQRKSASISYPLLEEIIEELTATQVGEQEKSQILNKAIDSLAASSSRGVNEIDRRKGIKEFFELLLLAFSIALVRLTLSPKIMALILTLYYMCNAKLKFIDTAEIMQQIKCVLKDIIKELLRKFIYDFLLPLILDAIKLLIKCYIKLKIKEKWETYYKQKLSLMIPPQFTEGVQKAQEALGQAGQVVDAAQGVVNSVNDFNIGSKNITIDLNKKNNNDGKFCG